MKLDIIKTDRSIWEFEVAYDCDLRRTYMKQFLNFFTIIEIIKNTWDTIHQKCLTLKPVDYGINLKMWLMAVRDYHRYTTKIKEKYKEADLCDW